MPPAASSTRTSTSVASGSPAKTAGSSCASLPLASARSTRTVSMWSWPKSATAAIRSKEKTHVLEARQGAHDLDRRHRSFLHHRQEQEDHAEQDGIPEVRSGRAQARGVQGSQDQVSGVQLNDRKRPPRGAFFFARAPKAGRGTYHRPKRFGGVMADRSGRQWLGSARGLAAALLLALAPVIASAAAPIDPSTESTSDPAAAPAPVKNAALPGDELPRHELETLALTDPGHVLHVVPGRLRTAQAAGDWREQALLQLARANACRVLANWPCQRTASTAARMAAALSMSPVLQVRGLIAEARAYISMQEFNQGERLLGAAEHILEKTPSPELSADIDLAYSSLSYMLDKPELAADYAARGLHALGPRPALPIRVRLLRNQANALTRLGRIDEARKAIGQAVQLLG